MEKLWLVVKHIDGVSVESLFLSEDFSGGWAYDTVLPVIRIEVSMGYN